MLLRRWNREKFNALDSTNRVLASMPMPRLSAHTNIACTDVCVDVTGWTSENWRGEWERYKRINILRALCSFLSVFCDLPLPAATTKTPCSFLFTIIIVRAFFLIYVGKKNPISFLLFFFSPYGRSVASNVSCWPKTERVTSFMCTIFFAFLFRSVLFLRLVKREMDQLNGFFFVLFFRCGFARSVVATAYGRVLSL